MKGRVLYLHQGVPSIQFRSVCPDYKTIMYKKTEEEDCMAMDACALYVKQQHHTNIK